MKKAISIILLLVFVASFATTMIASNAEAIPGCKDPVCVDGKVWLCCYEYLGNGTVVEKCRPIGRC